MSLKSNLEYMSYKLCAVVMMKCICILKYELLSCISAAIYEEEMNILIYTNEAYQRAKYICDLNWVLNQNICIDINTVYTAVSLTKMKFSTFPIPIPIDYHIILYLLLNDISYWPIINFVFT